MAIRSRISDKESGTEKYIRDMLRIAIIEQKRRIKDSEGFSDDTAMRLDYAQLAWLESQLAHGGKLSLIRG